MNSRKRYVSCIQISYFTVLLSGVNQEKIVTDAIEIDLYVVLQS